MAGDRTRIDCLEGNHADHYTTIAYRLVLNNNIVFTTILSYEFNIVLFTISKLFLLKLKPFKHTFNGNC